MFSRSRQARVQSSKTLTYPSPSGGWVQSGNIVSANPSQAEQLDNFIPTAQGARLRGGIVEVDDAGASVVRMFTYASGTQEEIFAATDTAIYDALDVAAGAASGSRTSGDWSTTQISTTGGQFLVGVNGADAGFTYNGSSFSAISLTGVASTALSQTWLFKERLFFVEKNTSSVWYLPVESIGGTVTEIDLGSVFAKGGNVLLGATWSLDSGSGLDDVCLFISDRGEIAVYEGTDPSSASTWSLVGVYDIGRPLNKHASFKAGGDLAILTEDGIIPVSQAIQKDRAALQSAAISYPIEDAWKEIVQQRSTAYPITATLWQSGTLLLVGTPGTYKGRNVAFAANARTGAWCRITGWDVRCSVVYSDELYFADAAGKIYKADSGGTDNGAAYTAVWCPKFQTSNQLGDTNAASVTYRAGAKVDITLAAQADYTVSDVQEPQTIDFETGNVWGTGVWGAFVWGSTTSLTTHTDWQAAYATGYSFAPSLAITSNQEVQFPFEVLIARLRLEHGNAL